MGWNNKICFCAIITFALRQFILLREVGGNETQCGADSWPKHLVEDIGEQNGVDPEKYIINTALCGMDNDRHIALPPTLLITSLAYFTNLE